MRILVALGGSTLFHRGEAVTSVNDHHAVEDVAGRLAGAVLSGHHLIITYGDAASVGLVGLQALNGPRAARVGLDMLQAQAQGWVGAALETALRNALPEGAVVVSMLTQTLVDRHDHALKVNDAPVGPVFDRETADRLAAELDWTVGPAGKGWCRLVPSPQPQDIVEGEAIRRLANTGATIICSGGGGIPVMRDADGRFVTIEATLEKDSVAALLAERVQADMLVFLTEVGGVYLDFGGPGARLIASAGPKELVSRAHHFSQGTMRAKVAAACAFVQSTGRDAAIGRAEDFSELVTGHRGTFISIKGGDVSFHDHDVE